MQFSNFLENTTRRTFNSINYNTVQFLRGKDRPEAHGSGILITINGRYFILTAAHVVDDDVDYYVPIAHQRAIIVSSHSFRRTDLPANGSRQDDKYDVAAVEIKGDIVESFISNGFQFIDSRQFKHHHIDSTHEYGIVGYVASQTKVRAGNIKSKLFQFKSFKDPNFNYSRHGFNQYIHIAIAYDGLMTSDNNENAHRAPNVEGISGCGLWVIGNVINAYPMLHFNTDENKRLLGIVIERVNQPPDKAIIAITMNFIFEFLVKNFGIGNKWKRPPLIPDNMRGFLK